jgi:hypothetical protein
MSTSDTAQRTSESKARARETEDGILKRISIIIGTSSQSSNFQPNHMLTINHNVNQRI